MQSLSRGEKQLNEKKALSSEQIQAKLKNLQSSSPQGAGGGDVEITVASQRDAFDLHACQALLQEHEIPSNLVGRGFNQVLVVSRDDSSRAIDVIAAHREQLLQTNPLSPSDYVVGIVFWAFACGLVVPGVGGLLLLASGIVGRVYMVVAIAILLVVSVLLGGFVGYLRSRAIAGRRRT